MKAIIMILVLFLLVGCSETFEEKCNKHGGTWVERGTDEVCSQRSLDDCGKDGQCMTFCVPAGGNLPSCTPECRHMAMCKCPEREWCRSTYYGDGRGCLYSRV
ncbi:MAG: hypothetical protein KKE20_04640 [Nanoarchaeota archaeon]|nr:hypothetical protein [Nanoarchaeota archaeon]